MEVMAALAPDSVADPDLAVACALLHDTVEDTEVSPDELEQSFGARVADGVVALSKNKLLRKSEAMNDSLERILRQPREVAIVKLADRVVNMEPPPKHWSGTKRQAYLAQAAEILRRLGSASATLSARLTEKMARYDEHVVMTASDWNIKTMPTQVEHFELTRTLTRDEWKIVRRGILPTEMEHKWFVYADESSIHFHRSWTGFCIYRLDIVPADDGVSVVGGSVNRDRSQYQGDSIRTETENVSNFLDGWLGHDD